MDRGFFSLSLSLLAPLWVSGSGSLGLLVSWPVDCSGAIVSSILGKPGTATEDTRTPGGGRGEG